MLTINPDYPMFVLAFCIVSRDAYINQITPAVRTLKCTLFGHDLVARHDKLIHAAPQVIRPTSSSKADARESHAQAR